MSCNVLVGNWASGVWTDLGQPPNVSSLTISGYAVSPNTLGRLNNFIGTCYSGSGYAGPGTVDYDVVPDLTDQELAIVGALYSVSYYNGLVQAAMGAGSAIAASMGGLPFVSLREGDSQIVRANPAAIGVAYANLAKEANSQLKYLVNVYIQNTLGGNTPRDVEYASLIYPTYNGNGWIGGYGR